MFIEGQNPSRRSAGWKLVVSFFLGACVGALFGCTCLWYPDRMKSARPFEVGPAIVSDSTVYVRYKTLSALHSALRRLTLRSVDGSWSCVLVDDNGPLPNRIAHNTSDPVEAREWNCSATLPPELLLPEEVRLQVVAETKSAEFVNEDRNAFGNFVGIQFDWKDVEEAGAVSLSRRGAAGKWMPWLGLAVLGAALAALFIRTCRRDTQRYFVGSFGIALGVLLGAFLAAESDASNDAMSLVMGVFFGFLIGGPIVVGVFGIVARARRPQRNE